MGLDINIYKTIQPTKKLIDTCVSDEDSLPHNLCGFSIDENSTLERFKDLSFKKTVEYIDFQKTFADLGLKFEEYKWDMTAEKGYYFMLNDNEPPDMNLCDDSEDYTGWDLVVGWEMLKTIFKEEDWILAENIGWQRKGANTLFYEKDIWSHPPIVKESVLMEHFKLYFSHRTPQSEGGFGSGVEFKQSDSEMAKNFTENIISKFKEGETFVVYH